MTSKSANIAMAASAIFLIACAVRLLAIVLWNDPHVGDGIDESEYLALGQNIRLHGTLSFGPLHTWGMKGALDSIGLFPPTAARAPLYPLMIAALWWGERPPIQAIFFVQALMGAAVAALTYCLALRTFERRTALIAGAAMAFAPLSVRVTAEILSETLFTFLLIASVWCWGKQRGLAAGLLLGLATLTRPILLLPIALLGVFALVSRFNRPLHAWIVVGALLVVTPWTIRNAVALRAIVPVAAYGWGSDILVGTIDVPYGTADNPWFTIVADPEFTDSLKVARSEREAEAAMLHAAVRRIVDDPVHWLGVRLHQYPRMLVDSGMYLTPVVPLPLKALKGLFQAGSALFWVLSFAGMFVARHSWRDVYQLALFPLFFLLAQFPAHADVRYILPAVPMLVIFAALALSRAAQALPERRRYILP